MADAMNFVYHYTDKRGFAALANGAVWYPSTGVPFAHGRSLVEHIQLSIMRAQNLFYEEQYEARDYRNTRSSQFPDVHYGPGWYVTEAPPDTETSFLLDELWQGRADCMEKTGYWLKIIASKERLKWPDGHRPTVAYLPIFSALGGDTTRPAGINADPVFLIEAGRRRQRPGQATEVQVLRSYQPPVETIPPMIAAIDAWSFLDSDKQCNILGFLGFDSGFPGVPFPEDVVGLSVERKQMFAIAQIATKSLGAAFYVRDVLPVDSVRADSVFAFDIVGNLALPHEELRTVVHCRQQRSPMRRGDTDRLRERASAHGASLIIAFVTSTFALGALNTLAGVRAAPILITASTSTVATRPAVRMVILDGEVVQYPDHRFWTPVRRGAAVEFEPLRSGEQVLGQVGRRDEA